MSYTLSCQYNDVTTITDIACVCVLQDKKVAIPLGDLGRSIATVQVLQRKHEAFERELSALGNKVGRQLHGAILNSVKL